MKVIIEIEKDEDMEIVKKAFKGKPIAIVKIQRDRKKKILEGIYKKYNVKLPADYRFNREEIHAR